MSESTNGHDVKIKFIKKNTKVVCECGNFEIDLLILTDAKMQEMLNHANEVHKATSISLVDDFST